MQFFAMQFELCLMTDVDTFKNYIHIETYFETQCSLKCLVDEDVKACKEGCFKVKAKSLYVVMEDYLKKKKELMETKCQDLCSKTGQTGDIYNCWKCRMAEQMTRVARCRHKYRSDIKNQHRLVLYMRCQHKAQKTCIQFLPARKSSKNCKLKS